MKKQDQNTNRPLHALISGGGTGGHIFPAISIANALRRRHPDAKILFVGAENRMEMERVPAAGYEIIGLPVSGFDRKKLWRNFTVLLRLWKSIRKARRIVREFQPDVAIGVGGYASGPTLKAAQRAGVPTLLQEQNSYPGVTNKLLCKNAEAICVAYDGTEKFFPSEKIIMTGNPVRKELHETTETPRDARLKLGLDPDKPLVLVVGGSLGARTLNNAILAAAESGETKKVQFQILWQTGKNDSARCTAAANKVSDKNLHVTTFISDMACAYRAADLVVARAGAGTISELELLGKATILVPSPNVAEDHQRHNAQALVDKGAAVMVLDAEAPEKLWPEICSLMADGQKRNDLSKNISALALCDSDEKIADIVDRITGK